MANPASTQRLPGAEKEVARRRTFAIISHPDAGKTTLTEKLLLYGGAVELAGAVRTRKDQRHARSDWMEMEQQRGISITSTVLQFEYGGCLFNLLDTPGHQDFSEDTYRTLMAADSAIMVLDAAKGIEPQTLRLFEVCRMRKTPILTFINKLDRPSREPLELLDEIERILGLETAPLNWPIGNGPTFGGVYDLPNEQVWLFQRTEGGGRRSPVVKATLDDPKLREMFPDDVYAQVMEETELLTEAGTTFDHERFLQGEMTPVFFGSAITNFGVEPFIQALIDLAPAPGPRNSDTGPVDPCSQDFSAFVFKVQANLDPRHRDRVAYVRICSGRFEKDMQVTHGRSGSQIRLKRSYRLFGQERETVDEGFAGDVIGLVHPGTFSIGDTLYAGKPVKYEAVPRFQPEHFARASLQDTSKRKQFDKGLAQLEEEGVVQVFFEVNSLRKEPMLAAVGDLQFDVLKQRMSSEYNVELTLDHTAYSIIRWLGGDSQAIERAMWPTRGTTRIQDRDGRVAVLFESDWHLRFTEQQNPKLEFARFDAGL